MVKEEHYPARYWTITLDRGRSSGVEITASLVDVKERSLTLDEKASCIEPPDADPHGSLP